MPLSFVSGIRAFFFSFSLLLPPPQPALHHTGNGNAYHNNGGENGCNQIVSVFVLQKHVFTFWVVV